MKKKLIVVLIALSAASVLLSGFAIVSVQRSVENLYYLIQLHQAAGLREILLARLEGVQEDLTLKGTRFARNLDALVSHASEMSVALDTCLTCHHSEQVQVRLQTLHDKGETFKLALSRINTVKINATMLREDKDKVFHLGEELIEEVDGMVITTNRKMMKLTRETFDRVNRFRVVLFLLVILAPMMVIGVAVWIFVSFTKPVSSLLKATSRLKEGDLDYRIEGFKDEFGELAGSFNEMSGSLKELIASRAHTEQMALMGEMASRLAHEVKNPITGIKLSIQVVLDEIDLDEEHSDLLMKTLEQIKVIELLMQNLLNFARPPASHMEMEDLNHVIDNTASAMEIILQRRSHPPEKAGKVVLARDLADGIPMIMADAIHLQQVLLNLMLNAVDAMPKGGTLTVRSFKTPEDGFWRVEVSDTGEGILPEHADRIFNPFFTTKPKGSGLGLAICKRLVEQDGGRISFRNNEGDGTTFCLHIFNDPGNGVRRS